jgi:inorganic pyrophosphatase
MVMLSRLQRSTVLGAASRLSFASCFSTVTEGSKYATDYKTYLKLPDGKVGSFFHDIPLNLNKDKRTVNVVIEIPRWSNAKFEISKQNEYNPITQDMKNGKPRFVKNLFPFKGYIHNYGALPQTWDDPTVVDKETGFKGDNDPIDVCEIGSKISSTGDVFEAKVLGSLALIDDGELDWKVIVINTQDELADKLNDIDDVFRLCPGLLESTRRWFKDYKIPDGKPENVFGFLGEYLGVDKTIETIEHSNDLWKKLIQNRVTGELIPLIKNSTLKDTPGFTPAQISQIVKGKETPESAIPSSIDKVYYV